MTPLIQMIRELYAVDEDTAVYAVYRVMRTRKWRFSRAALFLGDWTTRGRSGGLKRALRECAGFE